MNEKVKKVPIGQIGKEKKKITIVDTIVHESGYLLVPPLTLRQVAESLLDPSELEDGSRHNYLVYIAKEKVRLGKPARDTLLHYLEQTNALNSGMIYFREESRWEFAKVKHKLLKKFNLRNIRFTIQSFSVTKILIESNVPLYDPHVHEKHVQNILYAIKRRHPETTSFLDPESCRTGGKCSLGIEAILRKIAEENQRESR